MNVHLPKKMGSRVSQIARTRGRIALAIGRVPTFKKVNKKYEKILDFSD